MITSSLFSFKVFHVSVTVNVLRSQPSNGFNKCFHASSILRQFQEGKTKRFELQITAKIAKSCPRSYKGPYIAWFGLLHGNWWDKVTAAIWYALYLISFIDVLSSQVHDSLSKGWFPSVQIWTRDCSRRCTQAKCTLVDNWRGVKISYVDCTIPLSLYLFTKISSEFCCFTLQNWLQKSFLWHIYT